MDNGGEKSGARDATRARLVKVFNRLLLEGASPRPKVAQVIAEAGVARSTFYDHFDGIEALSNESLAGLFAAISECLVSSKDDAQLVSLLEHIWENRTQGRELLTGVRAERTEALFAKQVEARLKESQDARLHAILIAGTAMSALSGWATGRMSTPPSDLARTLKHAAQAILSGGDC